ncbi:Aldo/keto reductase family protein [Aspergillus parasiticus SU-1]|uniref:Aldo/keto reductase family protein n=1 Tax=Aspergillus parasiticus (strain ATCC 56775 / NRRL 5862 / SRRC 143 / SU-1) TaxID=1403190 RepID=A0A0F0IL70_ASPPU|nr:Aldo/keto reductase family protein [Aspergillus parasiticus SU-1]
MPLPVHPPARSPLDRHRQLAPSASVRVSPLCLGAMNFGDAWKDSLGECSKETTFEILDYFVSEGGNFIDTANNYQNEESEKWIGEWITQRQNRDQLVLATKFSSSYKNHESDKLQSNYGGNGAKSMRVSLELSLQKLQTSYIDLFYLHWWDYTVSIPELMHSLNDLVVSGKVIYLGISDCPAWVVAKANQYARDHGLRQFSVYQGLWNASFRDFEREILPMCRDENMGLVPWGTLGQGQFHTEAGYKEREQNNPGRKGRPPSDAEKSVSKVLETIANSKETNLTSIALAYIRHKAPYVFPVVGGRKVKHLRGNIAALDLSLSVEEMAQIEAAYPFDHGFPHTFLSGTLFDGSSPRTPDGSGGVWLTKLMGNFDWVKPGPPIEWTK